MKIKFRGWSREVYPHNRNAAPVKRTGGRYIGGKAGDPIEWESATRAYAKLSNLGLNGDFLLEIDFDSAELRNWLSTYVRQEPAAAIRMLARMQGEATIALAQMMKNEAVNEIQEDEA